MPGSGWPANSAFTAAGVKLAAAIGAEKRSTVSRLGATPRSSCEGEDSTRIGAPTDTATATERPPEDAVIVVEPRAWAVTTPASDTLATAGSAET